MIIEKLIKAACYWAAELVCAGHYGDLWESIILFISRYIHLGNPKLPIYISMRFKIFKELVSGGYIGNELAMRNNAKVRQLFAEIISILCHSRKKHSLEAIKIQKVDEFNMTHMASRLKAPKIGYVEDIFKSNNKNYEKFKDSSLNAYAHFYDWADTGNNIFHQNQRRFWISN